MSAEIPTIEDVENSTMGGRIQMARAARGLSSKQLALRIGVLPKTLGNWERDRSEPRINRLQEIANILNVSLVWLLGGDVENSEMELDAKFDETASLAIKLDMLMDMQQRMATLLCDVQGEVARLQSEIDDGSLNS
ncbi:helix-turn-helix domain-containing protein [Sneathiella chinensis]|uniref:Transcriptional regulator n=1 Tax=Sneathiella chinensis TaxID=349750 RepID=A0ABQ5U082_9PROT|nr:helix-turn-helix transcriptional regulator [Sneathiella chinensis]GLQ04821.1 transcriptional regulator [Sneathiella chinensis]